MGFKELAPGACPRSLPKDPYKQFVPRAWGRLPTQYGRGQECIFLQSSSLHSHHTIYLNTQPTFQSGTHQLLYQLYYTVAWLYNVSFKNNGTEGLGQKVKQFQELFRVFLPSARTFIFDLSEEKCLHALLV